MRRFENGTYWPNRWEAHGEWPLCPRCGQALFEALKLIRAL